MVDHHVPREDMDSEWCVFCCHSHPSGQVCDSAYIRTGNRMLDNDRCSCDADHHPSKEKLDAVKALHLEKTGEPVDDDAHAIELHVRGTPEEYD